jgi:hypothetical protein
MRTLIVIMVALMTIVFGIQAYGQNYDLSNEAKETTEELIGECAEWYNLMVKKNGTIEKITGDPRCPSNGAMAWVFKDPYEVICVECRGDVIIFNSVRED